MSDATMTAGKDKRCTCGQVNDLPDLCGYCKTVLEHNINNPPYANLSPFESQEQHHTTQPDKRQQESSGAVLWHPASEPPDSDREVLLLAGLHVTGFYDNHEHRYYSDEGIEYPTHWVELPAPPST